MVRTKYEDTVYEKPEYSGKIFIYCSFPWDVLYPFVNIIRLLRKNTIIGHAHTKGQQNVRLYGTQYGHLVIGYDLKNKKDYLETFKAVKNIFIFSDTSDPTATNLINTAKKNKINVICYSTLDNLYHFYNYTKSETGTKHTYQNAQDVIDKLYALRELDDAKKIADLFPDFEIIEAVINTNTPVLDECLDIIKNIDNEEKKKKASNTCKKIFDPHLNKLKHMENERSQRNMFYPDSVENIVKKEQQDARRSLSLFFTKAGKK